MEELRLLGAQEKLTTKDLSEEFEESSMQSRRDFLKTGAYIAPVILTVAVRPSFAVSAYRPPKGNKGNNGLGNGLDPQPRGNPKPNDEPTAIPGQPNAKGNKRIK